MLTIPAAGTRFARELEDAEMLTNQAIAAYAKIKQTMVAVRLDTDLPQYAGQESLMRLQKGETLLVEAMSNLARVHAGLRKDFIRETASPDMPGHCPTRGHNELDGSGALKSA